MYDYTTDFAVYFATCNRLRIEEVASNVLLLVGGSAGKYLHEFYAALFGKAMRLYSHSYLNLGLMAVRAAVFQSASKDAQGQYSLLSASRHTYSYSYSYS